MTGSDITMDEENIPGWIVDKVEKAKCPSCGFKVILPRKALREDFGGDKSKYNPQVWCSDMGHWIGFLKNCK